MMMSLMVTRKMKKLKSRKKRERTNMRSSKRLWSKSRRPRKKKILQRNLFRSRRKVLIDLRSIGKIKRTS